MKGRSQTKSPGVTFHPPRPEPAKTGSLTRALYLEASNDARNEARERGVPHALGMAGGVKPFPTSC